MIGFISEKLLIPILDFFYGLVPSYGLAIVALTVVIRIALFPLSAGSIRSARRMKIAQPVMQKRQAEIKSKFAGDPKKQQEELGKLMNEFGSPLAGCLPLIVQMPVLFALFATLRGSPFADVPYNINLKVIPQDQIAAIDPKPYKSPRHSIFITEKSHFPVIATISNGKTFTWDSTIAARFTTRASTTTTSYVTALTGDDGNPTASRMSLISPTTRHLIHLGTETTIGTASSQDDMFLRFSDQEKINVYPPSATNSAGTYRLQDGSKIMGGIVAKENILIWTDNALYSMKFVGAPFTFGFEQVGTNCGLIGQNAVVEIDGVAYWLGNNGFFSFDGTVNNLPCSVEDYVFDDFDTTKGQQVNAGINNLFTEVIWYYPTLGETYNDRYVVHNYGESQKLPMGNWYIGSNTNSIRTTWIDSIIYPQPYATQFNSTSTGTFPSIIGETGLGQTVYFQHETGTDQINPDGSTTTLTSHVQSYNFSLQKDQTEVFLAMRRFIPNFKLLGIEFINHALIGVNEIIKNNIPATNTAPKAACGV